MRRLASALGAAATLSLLAGCAADGGYYGGGYGGGGYTPYAYGYGYDSYYDEPFYPYGPAVGLGFGYYDGGGSRYRDFDGHHGGGRPWNSPPHARPQGVGPQAAAPQANARSRGAAPNGGNPRERGHQG